MLVAAIKGSRRALFVAGEPGVGKSRLVAALAERARAREMVVLVGRCDAAPANTFGPFTEALRPLVLTVDPAVLADYLGRWPQELVRLVPELEQILPELPARLVTDPETERSRLFDAVVSLLDCLGSVSGVVLILDDLQWAPEPTLALLRHVLKSEGVGGFTVVGTYRDTAADLQDALVRTIDDVRGHEGVECITLSGLDEEAMARVVAR